MCLDSDLASKKHFETWSVRTVSQAGGTAAALSHSANAPTITALFPSSGFVTGFFLLCQIYSVGLPGQRSEGGAQLPAPDL